MKHAFFRRGIVVAFFFIVGFTDLVSSSGLSTQKIETLVKLVKTNDIMELLIFISTLTAEEIETPFNIPETKPSKTSSKRLKEEDPFPPFVGSRTTMLHLCCLITRNSKGHERAANVVKELLKRYEQTKRAALTTQKVSFIKIQQRLNDALVKLINAQDSKKNTPFLIAYRQQNIQTAHDLLDRGAVASFSNSLVKQAILQNDAKIIRHLFKITKTVMPSVLPSITTYKELSSALKKYSEGDSTKEALFDTFVHFFYGDYTLESRKDIVKITSKKTGNRILHKMYKYNAPQILIYLVLNFGANPFWFNKNQISLLTQALTNKELFTHLLTYFEEHEEYFEEAVNDKGDTLLHYLIKKAPVNLLPPVIAQTAKFYGLNKKNKDNQTPLELACKLKKDEAMIALIKKGAHLFSSNSSSNSSLSNSKQCVDIAKQVREDMKKNPTIHDQFFFLVKNCKNYQLGFFPTKKPRIDRETLIRLIKKFPKLCTTCSIPYDQSKYSKHIEEGSIVHEICFNNDLSLLTAIPLDKKLFLQKGTKGITPLDLSLAASEEIINYLVANIYPLLTHQELYPLLSKVISQNNILLMRNIIEKIKQDERAEFINNENFSQKKNLSIFGKACQTSSPELLKVLIGYGALINPKTGQLPLIFRALKAGNYDALIFLIENGALLDDQDKYGQTLLDHLCIGAVPYRVNSLDNKPVTLNSSLPKDKDGFSEEPNTYPHLLKVVKLYRKKKANLGNKKANALLAKNHGLTPLVELFEKASIETPS